MIRNYITTDLDAIVRIANAAYQNVYKSMRNELGDDIFQILVPNPNTCQGLHIMEQANTHPEWIIICEEQGQIVGFLTYYLIGETARISSTIVDPECALKGIGHQLNQAALNHFRCLKIKIVQVTTSANEAHAPTRRTYERSGFSVKSESENITYFMKL